MRPGYTVLLEFGWSVYLDNSSNLQTFDSFNSPALRHLFSSSKNHYKLLRKRTYKINYNNYFSTKNNLTKKSIPPDKPCYLIPSN